MKAMLVDEHKNLVWSDVPDPVIKTDEVLVKIHAAALNRADLLQREGKYPSPAGCPEWMGLEVSGENGHAGTPRDIADTALFLATQDFITGENIVVDGGRILGTSHR